MPTIKESAKKIYYQNVKPSIDKVMTNPVTAGLVGGVPGVIGSYFYRPDFDARNAKTQDEAYKMARSTGAKTFIWNGKQYNTDYKGNPKKTLVQQKQEELDTYGITNEQTQNKNKFSERLYNNISPYGYANPIERTYNAIVNNKRDISAPERNIGGRNDLLGLTLGYPQKNNTVGISNYSPTKINDKAPYYYKLNNEIDTQSYATNSEGIPLKVGENVNVHTGDLGIATVGRGNGYTSYYDKWDINPLRGRSSGLPEGLQKLVPDVNMVGKPLEIYDRQYDNNTKMATGGQLKAQNNAGITPYLYNSLPQYGLGSWLEENAGTIGSVAGGIGGFLVGGPAGAAIGSAALGGVGNMITQGHANEEKQDQFNLQQQQMSTQNAMNNYNAQQHPMYGTNFATGGFMPNVNTWQYSNVGGINYACGGKMANGGQIEPGMTGMMKARLAMANEFGNKTAQRITGKDGRSYTFTKEDADSINKQYPGANSYQGQKGNVMIGSYDNFATPSIQDVNGKLQYIQGNPWRNNPDRSYDQSIKFERPQDAEYFGNHYKEIAPMMKSGNFANGGQLGNDNGAAQMTKGLDNITVYPKSAQSHENNPQGGITIGKYGQTEGGETRIGKYIFSNRF